MTTLYNENGPFVADWLEDLIRHGHIAPGTVDRRSIADLTPADVAGHGQRHFFAGIGGWSHALRLTGVPDDADVWTGSCPCQPFSDAGKGGGVFDPRHLWPAWFALIEQCRPPIVFGEQVASRDGLEWLDAVSTDLERCGYAVGAADLCAAGVGAPHIRQRLYFVAYTRGERGVVDADRQQRQRRARGGRKARNRAEQRSDAHVLADASGTGPQNGRDGRPAIDRGSARSMGNPGRARSRRNAGDVHGEESEVRGEGGGTRREHGRLVDVPGDSGATRGFWSPADWILCRDPSGGDPVARPVEPGSFPLAHGVPGRVGLLSGYGNAIVPQVAAQFIRVALQAIGTT